MIKVGLVSALMKDNDINHQLEVMESYLTQNKDCDILCFGESFIQGFESLTWDYESDRKRALKINSPAISRIRKYAETYNTALSFGFIEREKDMFYSSNMVIDKTGKIINIFRRVSPGWKESYAGDKYSLGKDFSPFYFLNKELAVAICGDLWDDDNLDKLKKMKLLALLWPVYLDFSIEEWNGVYLKEYEERTGNLPYPVLMYNSYVNEENRAKGGAYLFSEGKTVISLPPGNQGILAVELAF